MSPGRRYHRLESPTQTPVVAAMQEASSEIWGTYDMLFGAPARLPSVDAYVGPLPDGADGIEFETEIEADVGLPPGRARWTGPRRGSRSGGSGR